MIDKIKSFLSENVDLDKKLDGSDVDRSLMVTIGALMLEMAGADNDYAPEEIQACFRSLEKQFGISDTEAMEILEQADSLRNDKSALSNNIEKLNLNFSEEQRQLILSLIWKVVVADEKIEKYELRIANQLRVRLQLSDEQAEDARKYAFEGKI